MQTPDAASDTCKTLCIGVDTGGTFTDVVMLDDRGRIAVTHKLLSTPDDPAKAVLDGIDALLRKIGAPGRRDAPPTVSLGSTVATNALLEGKTGATTFVTTAGFEDTLHLARQNRPNLYALVPRRSEPPVSRERCVGVEERMDHRGRPIRPLSGASVNTLIERLRASGVNAVAISLLHSYANPSHEAAVAEAIRAALGDELHITVSHELLPVYREYERAATCVVNAAVAPVMTRYIGGLAKELGERRLRIMGSHGGTLSPTAARREPVRTVLSGPAGGVLGALASARSAGITRIISFDMGGTSTDVSLCDGRYTLTSEGDSGGHRGEGLPIRLPMVDIHTVGAGGGSIAWVDPGGALRVGPQSAGADPGPACYGKQADDQPPLPTVTDAHVVLGHIAPDTQLGSGMRVQAEPAQRAVAHVAERIGMDLRDVADGILRVAEVTMSRAISQVSLQRGHDPRPFTLVTFGGAGGLHACRLAELLDMRRVLVPLNPGLLSAVGLLTAPPREMASRSLMWTIPAGESEPDLAGVFADLRDAITAVEDENWGFVEYTFTVDMRYVGQSYEITLDVDESIERRKGNADLIAAFHAEHERLYGYRDVSRAVELVVVRCLADGPERELSFGAAPSNTPDTPPTGDRVARHELASGHTLPGPVVITEYSATTLVPRGWSATVGEHGHLLLEREA